jgi:hypothetical protein
VPALRLGAREPDRSARCLRRGQTVRRDDGPRLPPRVRSASPESITPTARGCAPDDGRAVPVFIAQAFAGERLGVHGDGSQTRSLCYVDDPIAPSRCCPPTPSARSISAARRGSP